MYMFLWDSFIEHSWENMQSYAIMCDKWIAVWTFLWICGKKKTSPVRCDQSAAAIAVVQAHRSRSPEWTVFCIAFAKRWISMLFFWATTPFDWIHWYISLVFVNFVMRERNCHSAEVQDELSHISGSNYPVQLIPVAIWHGRSVCLLFFVVCPKKKMR